MSNAKYVVFGACACTAIIAIIVLLATSLHTLGPTDMGIDYNGLFMRIDETQLYTNGRHFLGPGHFFKVYKKEQQDVRFPGATPDGFEYPALTARTLDGLKVELQVAFQYQLDCLVPRI